MLLYLLIGLGVVVGLVGLLCLYVYLTGRRRMPHRAVCPIQHGMGNILARHELIIDCEKAKEVLMTAARIWHEVGGKKQLTLWVTSDPGREKGWLFHSGVVINWSAYTEDDKLQTTLVDLLKKARKLLAEAA